MKSQKNYLRTLAAAGVVVLTMLICGSLAAQVSPTAPAPDRSITPEGQQGPQRDHPQKQPPGVRAPLPVLKAPAPGNGTVEGFVYWDASGISHTPAGSCSGLAITVSVGTSSGGPLTSYTPLSTLSNNFKYVGQVRSYLAGGKIQTYDVCTYAYGHLPVGPNLQVTLTITQPMAFSPVATPQYSILGPIQIVNGQCNMLPPANPTAADLTGQWSTCQNRAYGVNFLLLHSQMLHTLSSGGGSGSGGLASGSRSVQVEKDSGPVGTPVLKNPGLPGSPSRGMLSGAPQQGMLATGAGSTTQSSSTDGGLQQHQGQQPSAITDGTRQTYTRGATPQTLTNADVTSMLNAGLAESVIISSIRSARKNFDFSPAGCQTLQRARVSAGILAAMGDGSVRPCPEITGKRAFSGSGFADPNRQAITVEKIIKFQEGDPDSPIPTAPDSKVELNPQPLPPRTGVAGVATPGANVALNLQPPPPGARAGSNSQGRAQKIDARNLKKSPIVKNSAIVTSPILEALRLQKQAADVQSSHILAAQSGARLSEAPPPLPAPGNGTNPAGLARIGLLPPTRVANVCAGGKAVISAVNEQASNLSRTANPTYSHTVFTPDSTYNHYLITGCGFGNTPGSIYLTAGASSFPAHNGRVLLFPSKGQTWGNQWSDGFINAQVDPNVTGEMDESNVSLVIEPANGGSVVANGFSFYAKRGAPFPLSTGAPISLTGIPQGDASVALFPSGNRYWHSPPNQGDCWCELENGWVFSVERWGGNRGTDVFDLKLRPGFVIDSAQTTETGNGTLLLGVSNTEVQVTQAYDGFEAYFLGIWVVGPAGISNPWPVSLPKQEFTKLP